jgi:hypothetical protein
MSGIIIRIYESVAQGAKAAQQLRDEGFEHVFEFKGTSGKSAAAVAERKGLVASLMEVQVWKSHAESYAERLSKGGALVVVHAPFGSALLATEILDMHEPVAVGLNEGKVAPDFVWDDAAPLSSALMLPVLTTLKLPAETLSGVPSLTKGSAFLSEWLGMPLLKQGAAHKNSSMGFSLLSRSATPLSSLFGMRTLSQNSTPLSSLFGMKVLSRRQ